MQRRDTMNIQRVSTTSSYQNSINNMKKTKKEQEKTSRQLSSGKKVNTAADDATVMAISKELARRASSLSAGSSNIQSGIDLTNIADGAMASISESIGDLETNTIRAMNGTMSDSDKAILNEANNQTLKTIDHVVNNTTYNGKNLLDGSNENISIYTGSASSNISGVNASTQALGLSNGVDLSSIDSALSSLSSQRSKMGAQANGLTAAYNSNQVNIENTVAAESRMSDTDMAEAITNSKTQSYLGAAQVLTMRNQMKNDADLVTDMLG